MCGISVIINGGAAADAEIEIMSAAIGRRGIRASTYSAPGFNVAFNYLPITDENARPQPYCFGGYRVWMNGYISNWVELAEKYDLLRHMTTSCDTELLALFIERFGLSKTDELNGFFAVFVIKGKNWHAFTDRFGIKQLYRYTKGGAIYLCSEVKGLLAVMESVRVSASAAQDLRYSLGVMTDDTIYEGIERIDRLSLPIPARVNISYDEAKEQLTMLLIKSFKRNKSAKVSDCVFLSGGIDSGLIAKWIKPDYCFSMDYVDSKYSEIDGIKSNSTGRHISMICNLEMILRYSKLVFNAIDDYKVGSCYTNYALAELASKFCTIIYSGAGGDEFFGGYPHRNDKPINEVIRRDSDLQLIDYGIDRFEYDMRFLRGVLVVEDRMSGYFTMETRYPLLDNDVVNFALSLPKEYIEGKRILKDVSGLSEAVKQGKKRGFSNPGYTNKEWADLCVKQAYKNERPLP